MGCIETLLFAGKTSLIEVAAVAAVFTGLALTIAIAIFIAGYAAFIRIKKWLWRDKKNIFISPLSKNILFIDKRLFFYLAFGFIKFY